MSDAVLAHPAPVTKGREYVIQTDASTIGLGAVLSQPDETGELRPVFFASRSLTPGERNYSAAALEALCCVWAAELFRPMWETHILK
jgi:hypothetical protein